MRAKKSLLLSLLLLVLLCILSACGTGTDSSISSTFVPDAKVQPKPIYKDNLLLGVVTVGLENDNVLNPNGSTSFTSTLEVCFAVVGEYNLNGVSSCQIVGVENLFGVYSGNDNNNMLSSPKYWVTVVIQSDHTIQYTVT